MEMHARQPPYGWPDFDPEVVAGLRARTPDTIDKSPDGWIRCPLVGHTRERLPWIGGDYRRGSEPHGSARASFRASPTYVLEDPLDNFIVGRDIVRRVTQRGSGKAETSRLGNENSEDAVTWNVFRSLHAAGRLDLATQQLLGIDPRRVDLFMWGVEVSTDDVSRWHALQGVRDHLEPGKGQQTEPDACLHVPGKAVALIEAKFGSPTSYYRADRREEWISRYASRCPGLFDEDAIRNVPPAEFPEQILRNVAFASLLARPGESATVVALVRERESQHCVAHAQRCMRVSASVSVVRATWERIYAALPATADEPALGPLRRYMETKSFRLRKAFAL
jgi:hypothetical protein